AGARGTRPHPHRGGGPGGGRGARAPRRECATDAGGVLLSQTAHHCAGGGAARPMKTESRAELTLRGIVLGVVLTVVFTAANVYFGLKAGLTFSTSIPAVVLSMALLRWLGNTTAQENNIVQTVASTAGTLSSIIFVLPGFVMIGWWTGFPYWQSVAICATGGVPRGMFSLPLRRALMTQSDLLYPEGAPCAEVIKVGSVNVADKDSDESSGMGLKSVLGGALLS